MHKPHIVKDSIDGYGNGISKSEYKKSHEEFKQLNMATNIWHQLLTTTVNAAFIPVIHAASDKNSIPPKPPKMKYTDLPIYKSPHYEYKDYIEDKMKCPDANVKILQRKLFPMVQKYRSAFLGSFYDMKKELSDIRKEIFVGICERSRCFKNYMRDPENLTIRRAIVSVGTAAGFYVGSGTGSYAKKIFFSSLGALAAGALCFPKETDEIFRNVSYNFMKFVIDVYNITCGQNISMRERLPCPDDLPPPPKPPAANQINKKCYEKKK